eukprot:GEZU01015847.1.p1 GENE.GEZU01015847.1~~GEZU01015847.1.p1  ORF type:complete len:362 (+),score=102.52 GEZU01015847.1:501-1586(+)
MDRFFCWGERDVKDQMSSFDFSNFAAWSKEDGTFMLMYNYRGKWYVNCRHNFADDRLPSKPDWTYRDLFEHASGGLTLDELGQRAQLDPRFSYAFELCSPYNKVIRQYNQPTLFLLTAHQTVVDEDESIARSDSAPKELTDDELGALAERMARESVNGRTVQRPQKFTRFHNMEEIIDYLQTDCMKNDPTFEGFVLKDGHNHRWKIKSLSYRSIHKLRYRGWVKATPRNLIDFVLEGEGPELLAILSQYPAFTPTTASGISAANNNNNNNNSNSNSDGTAPKKSPRRRPSIGRRNNSSGSGSGNDDSSPSDDKKPKSKKRVSFSSLVHAVARAVGGGGGGGLSSNPDDNDEYMSLPKTAAG